MLQPGPEVISKEGGLQSFTDWNGPMMTDSGGYQIFSLGYGSVSEEIKGKNNNTSNYLKKVHPKLMKINLNGDNLFKKEFNYV